MSPQVIISLGMLPIFYASLTVYKGFDNNHLLWLYSFGAFILFLSSYARTKNEKRFDININTLRLDKLVKLNFALMLLFSVFMYQIYDGIPLIDSIVSDRTLSEFEHREKNSCCFVLGIHLLLIYMAIFLILAKIYSNFLNKKNNLEIVLFIFATMFFALMNGRRQSLIFLFFVLLIYILQTGSINSFISHFFKIKISRKVITMIVGLTIFLFSIIFTTYSSNRDSENISLDFSSNFSRTFSAYTWPVKNFKYMTYDQDLIIFKPDYFSKIWVNYLPYKLRAHLKNSDDEKEVELKKKNVPVPGASFGFLGGIYFTGGIISVFFYCLLIGRLLRFFYLKSQENILFIFPYALSGWSIFMMSFYNHFTTLNFFIAPLIIFYFVYHFITRARE